MMTKTESVISDIFHLILVLVFASLYIIASVNVAVSAYELFFDGEILHAYLVGCIFVTLVLMPVMLLVRGVQSHLSFIRRNRAMTEDDAVDILLRGKTYEQALAMVNCDWPKSSDYETGTEKHNQTVRGEKLIRALKEAIPRYFPDHAKAQ